MKTHQSQITRKYKRQSKSKWQEQDDSTILLLATIEDEESLSLKYDRYIYLHRDEVGRWLGISLSNQIQRELVDDNGKFRESIEMLEVLTKYHHDISGFLAYFSDEIEAIFGIDAATWLVIAQSHWHYLLKNSNYISDSK